MDFRYLIDNYFVNYIKAFDSLWHYGIWAVLDSYRVPEKLITLLQNLYAKSQLTVKKLKIRKRLRACFTAELASRHSDLITLLVFISLLESVMEATECNSS